MKRGLLAFLILVLLAAAAGTWLVRNQGVARDHWASYAKAEVRFDDDGIPTISAPDWESVYEAQGYVVASERMFQMDLMRRASAGRLSEWFGARALPLDRKRRLEDWSGIAEEAVGQLPAEQKQACEAYARGVNAYIEQAGVRVGLEYLVLGASAEPWSCADSLLIVLSMAEQLSASATSEAEQSIWRDALSPGWAAFLFPRGHPWDAPMFGPPEGPPDLPLAEALPRTPLTRAEVEQATRYAAAASFGSRPELGSNNWAWCGGADCFLANDPHLGASVPQLWFANRLRVSKDDWLVGVSIPGIPGQVIGMSPQFSWVFTNTMEDVDDFLRERLSEDGTRYLARMKDGKEVWADVELKTSTIQVKDGEPVEVVGRWTHRGPLVELDQPKGTYSRQWLALRPEHLRLALGFSRARTWEELLGKLDEFVVPSQNVVVGDRAGTIAYRMSGVTLKRVADGRRPQPALTGEWDGFLDRSTRPARLLLAAGRTLTGSVAAEVVTSTGARMIVTANERVWVDEFGHPFADPRRGKRIREVLTATDSMSADDMRKLQLDTVSHHHRQMARWIGEHTSRPESPVVKAWATWDGSVDADAESFTRADRALGAARALLIGRVQKRVFGDKDVPEYRWRRWRSWLLKMMSEDGGSRVFGLEDRELADHLLEVASAPTDEMHPEANRWQAQHPLTAAPVIGAWFRVAERPQVGHKDCVRAELPRYGPSMRLVADTIHPSRSTWSFPVGQSGHPFSPHYQDARDRWWSGVHRPVFDRPADFGLE